MQIDTANASPAGVPDILERLEREVLHIIQRRTGLHDHLALPITTDIIAALRRRFGGDRLYVPQRPQQRKRVLGDALRAQYTGDNRDALCRAHHISRRTFYRLLSQG